MLLSSTYKRMDENTTKTVYVCLDKKVPKTLTVISEDEAKSRQITEHWHFRDDELTHDNILNHLLSLCAGQEPLHKALQQQLNYKVAGYRYQDLKKGLYDPGLLIDTTYVGCLLIEKNLTCYYCQNKVQLMYTSVREPQQWTLDRIDNSKGHNRGNVEIACLQCNLRRRTMHHERYVFTKQMSINKIG